MSRVYRNVTLELKLDPEQRWEVSTDNPSGGHDKQRMDVFYVKWEPNSIYATVSGYVISSREPLEYSINWMKTIKLTEVPSQVKNQLLSACHPVDLAKS